MFKNKSPFPLDIMVEIIMQAPGRLDVMGGIADYSGSWVLQYALNRLTTVTARTNRSGKIKLTTTANIKGIDKEVVVSIDDILAQNYIGLQARLSEGKSWTRYVLGGISVLSKEKGIELRKGADITVRSRVPAGAAISSSAALEVPSMLALLDLNDPKRELFGLEPAEIAELCQKVENYVAGAACGRMDQIISLMGTKNRLLPIYCQGEHPLGDEIELPNDIAFVGINTGVKHSVAGSSYTDTRIGAMMAAQILRRQKILKKGGHLCDLTPEQFLEANIRSTMTGQEFLGSYGALEDPVVVGKVVSVAHYSPWARAHHAVYENQRVQKFMECLNKYIETGDDKYLVKAGKLMYASNWSYTYRARLGCREVNMLVQDLRELGPDQGIYGAKIIGGGCGGTVAVLYKKEAKGTIKGVMKEYQEKTGYRPTLFDGSSDGALKLRAARMARE